MVIDHGSLVKQNKVPGVVATGGGHIDHGCEKYL